MQYDCIEAKVQRTELLLDEEEAQLGQVLLLQSAFTCTVQAVGVAKVNVEAGLPPCCWRIALSWKVAPWLEGKGNAVDDK